MGCYIWYSEEGPRRAAAPPSPLLVVPNVTAYPLTASVSTSYYSTWQYNCMDSKRLNHRHKAWPSRDGAVLMLMIIMLIRSSFVRNFVYLSPTPTCTCRAMVWLAKQRNSAGGRERTQRCWASRTTGVPDVSSPREKLHPDEIYASGGRA